MKLYSKFNIQKGALRPFKRYFGMIAAIVLQSLTVSSQHKNLLDVTKEDLIADYRLAMDILKKQHPNPYKFIDSTDFNRKVDSLLTMMNAQPDVLNCSQYSPLYLIRDVHTNLRFSEDNSRNIFGMIHFFPFPVIIEREKIFINIKGAEIPFGSEVLSIDGMTVKDIIAALVASVYSDGHINTGTDRIASNFQLLFSLLAPDRESFRITYTTPGSSAVKKVTIPFSSPTKAFHDSRLAILPMNQLQRAYLVYRNYFDDTKTGLLTINTFSLSESAAYKEFSEFFKEVNQRGYEHVIIDIRSNGGGNPAISALLYSFLADAPFKNVYNYRTRTIDIAYPEYAIADYGRKLSDEDIRNHKNFLYQRFDKDSSGIYIGNARLKEGQLENFPPDKDAFKGKVYVLTGGGTVSAATYFASLVRKNKRGLVIGKETGSGEKATTAAWFLKYMLPRTKSILTVPLSELYFFNASADDGRGLIPDREVPLEKFVTYARAGQDPELMYALELINAL